MRKSTYVCGVCGADIETDSETSGLAKTQQVWVKKSPSDRVRYDFCKTCYDSLINYLHEHADGHEDDGGPEGSENTNNGEEND